MPAIHERSWGQALARAGGTIHQMLQRRGEEDGAVHACSRARGHGTNTQRGSTKGLSETQSEVRQEGKLGLRAQRTLKSRLKDLDVIP